MEKKRLYKEIIEELHIPLVVIDEESKIIYSNPAVYELFMPIHRLEGRSIKELLGKAAERPLSFVFKDGKSVLNYEITVNIKGEEKILSCDFFPLHTEKQQFCIATIKDLTQKKILEKKEEKEKLLFQNLDLIERAFKKIEPHVSAIVSTCNLLEDKFKNTPELEFIKNEALRALFIIEEALNFALSKSELTQQVNLHKLIENALISLSKQIRGKNLIIKRDYLPNIPEIEADALELYKAFYHLLKNATEATPDGKNIEIRTYIGKSRIFPGKNTLVIEITNEGKELDDYVKTRLFSPFVTTENGRIGLGLATAYKVIKDHGGDIEYIRQNEKNTFRILLPI